MNVSIKFQDVGKLKVVAKSLIEAVANQAAQEVTGLPDKTLDQVVKTVETIMMGNLDILTDGAQEVVLEYDLDVGIANCFESVCRYIKQTASQENG